MKPYLSLIIPAYKCSTIDKDLEKVNNFLLKQKITYEIICVVDGLSSQTDPTLKNANKIKDKHIQVITYPQNKGKGYAVRFGFKKAKGEIIGFFDAGSDIDVHDLKTALETFKEKNADIVIGSKRHPQSTINNYPSRRRTLSLLSQAFARLLFGLSVTDTQVGLKLFSSKLIKELLPKLSINGFAFDLEVLSKANRLGYKKIHEVPVHVTYNQSSTIQLMSLFRFALDTVKIIFR